MEKPARAAAEHVGVSAAGGDDQVQGVPKKKKKLQQQPEGESSPTLLQGPHDALAVVPPVEKSAQRSVFGDAPPPVAAVGDT